MVQWGSWKVRVYKIVFGYTTQVCLVISKASNIDNWNSLFEFVRMLNIVDLCAAAQTGLSNRWQAIAEDEF